MKWIYEHPDWPKFNFDKEKIENLLTTIHRKEAGLFSVLNLAGIETQKEFEVNNFASEIISSSKIESINLDENQVRSSIKRRLNLESNNFIKNRYIDGYIEVMIEATRLNVKVEIDRLSKWHSALFPSGRDDFGNPLNTGAFRNDFQGLMTIQSGAMGKEKIHYLAPPATVLEKEMNGFIKWYNSYSGDKFLKSAVAHYWFLAIHPFDDGNGRLARVIAEHALNYSTGTAIQSYSVSESIEQNRKEYYQILELTSLSSDLNITKYIYWYLTEVNKSLTNSHERLKNVLKKISFWQSNKIQLNERQSDVINRLFDDSFSGKLNTDRYSKIYKVSKETASLDLRELSKNNILKTYPGGGRSTSYYLTAVGPRKEFMKDQGMSM